MNYLIQAIINLDTDALREYWQVVLTQVLVDKYRDVMKL